VPGGGLGGVVTVVAGVDEPGGTLVTVTVLVLVLVDGGGSVVILSVPDGALEDGDVVAWLPCWFAHAANGAMVVVTTTTAKDAPLFMGRAYPNWRM
jgi:hypothetical protein